MRTLLAFHSRSRIAASTLGLTWSSGFSTSIASSSSLAA